MLYNVLCTMGCVVLLCPSCCCAVFGAVARQLLCGAASCGAASCGAASYDAASCGAASCGAASCGAASCDALSCGTASCSARISRALSSRGPGRSLKVAPSVSCPSLAAGRSFLIPYGASSCAVRPVAVRLVAVLLVAMLLVAVRG